MSRLTVWMLMWLCTAAVSAAYADAARAPQTHTSGLAWEITAPNGQRSTLLGTIHSDDSRVMAWARQFDAKVDGAARIFLELDMDDAEMRKVSYAMFLPASRSLRAMVGDPMFAQTSALMQTRGLKPDEVDRIKPWAAMVLLSMPPNEDGVFLDKSIYDRGRAAGKSVHGLETPLEQVAVFDELSEADQVKLLRGTVELGDKLPVLIDQMTTAYLQRDLRALEGLYRQYLEPDDAALAQRVHQRLVVKRNRRMFERVRPYLAHGDNFIAVGALHLAGSEGLLALLEQSGFRLRRVDQ